MTNGWTLDQRLERAKKKKYHKDRRKSRTQPQAKRAKHAHNKKKGKNGGKFETGGFGFCRLLYPPYRWTLFFGLCADCDHLGT